jgi:hypothetical protein
MGTTPNTEPVKHRLSTTPAKSVLDHTLRQ